MVGRCLINTGIKQTSCPRCGRPLLVAIDEGMPVRVDRFPVGQVGGDEAGELRALLEGRRTYVRAIGGLVERTSERIRGGTLRGDVHREHRCAPDDIARRSR